MYRKVQYVRLDTYKVIPMQVHRDTAQGFRMKGYTVESLDTVAENTEEFLPLLLE
jgi:hypothetical protein